jgi:hypothetical protein
MGSWSLAVYPTVAEERNRRRLLVSAAVRSCIAVKKTEDELEGPRRPRWRSGPDSIAG